jgi:FtsP/CotA-like multicopper oxidase with cupredoxin domain
LISRRRFVRVAAGAAAAMASGIPALASCGEGFGPGADRFPLRRPAGLLPGASLTAAPGTASTGDGGSRAAWLFNGELPGPTLRCRRGDRVQVQLVDGLAEPTIVHWHGLLVPAGADGHPRDAIGAGGTFAYDFPIVQRAGTFWYHPHAHHRTAEQLHRGLAGFLLIGDDEEDALGLPAGEQEILLILQDRDGDAARALEYAPDAADLHAGMLRGVAYGNGVRLPTLDVAGGCYRFRIVNASHARVYRIALDAGALTVIGNDGGLLPTPAVVPSLWLGVGERADFLVDFTAAAPGTRLMLRSLPFELPAAGGAFAQGTAMDLLELVRVRDAAPPMPALPPTLSSVPPLGAPLRERTFDFDSTGDGEMHRINDHVFDMDRVDLQVPLGEVERWTFRNGSALPHPVHLHGTHFQVVSRTGGRGLVLPYETGWKDTVLVLPAETVEVLVRFDTYGGLFLLHCHNLQHEDLGMMLNVEVG